MPNRLASSSRPARLPSSMAVARQRTPPATAAASPRQKRYSSSSARLIAASAAANDARGAIDAGIELMSEGDPSAALAEFSRALTLPGTGLKRYRDKPPSLTDGEKAAALYNAACAHAALGDKAAALSALSAAVGDANFDDGRAAAADEDLASLRGDPAFEALVGRLRAEQDKKEQGKKKGFLGGLFG